MKYLISYLCRNRNDNSISYGMTVAWGILDFLRLTKLLYDKQYVILNIAPLTKEEAAEIEEERLHLL